MRSKKFGLFGFQYTNRGWPFADIPKSQSDALIAFYDATGGDSWDTNTGWKTDTTVNNWHGVTVSGGNVTAIELPGNSLSTDAASVAALDFSALPSLATIDLSDNGFSAAVVGEFLEEFEAAALTDASIDLSSNTAPDYGTEGSPSDAAYAVGDLVTRGNILTLNGTVPGWVLDLSADEVLTVTAADFHIATRDGEAMFFEDDQDYAAYDGAFFLLEDSSGVRARAWSNGVGEGADADSTLPALDDELIPDPTCATDFWDAKEAGWSHDAANDEFDYDGTDSFNGMREAGIFNEGSLYEVEVTIANLTQGAIAVYSNDGTSNEKIIGNADLRHNGEYTHIVTALSSGDFRVYAAAWTGGRFIGSVSNLSLKKLTDIPSSGLKLVSTQDGTTRNMTEVESGFDPNDVTKVRVYGKLEEVKNVTEGSIKIATADGEAMFFHDDDGTQDDYSDYDGKLIEFEDDAGLVARGYANGVGGGEALDDNLAPTDCCTDPANNVDAVGDWSPVFSAALSSVLHGSSYWLRVAENGEDHPSGKDTDSTDLSMDFYDHFPSLTYKTVPGSEESYSHYAPADDGSLYKLGYSIKEGTGDYRVFRHKDNSELICQIDSASGSGEYVDFGNVYLTKLTDIPSTGLHLVSESGGSTRNMAHVETGFDPNSITKVRIFEA